MEQIPYMLNPLKILYARDVSLKNMHELKNPAASCEESSTVRNSVNFLIRSLLQFTVVL